MGKTLTEIAKKLKNANSKVQLIYAFNGTGKTRLSREFKRLTRPKHDEDDLQSPGLAERQFLYYSAFTEDLFYWHHEQTGDADDAEPYLKIQPNTYTVWLFTLLKVLGQDGNIVKHFQRYTNDKLTPHFNPERIEKNEEDEAITIEANSEVTFTMERGDESASGLIKISKGEESNFIWSVFYALLSQVIAVRNVSDPDERETEKFDRLEYVFIDDPVSSLDDSHLIQVAVDLAELIKSNQSEVKFIITTHNPLFFNVLCNEFGRGKKCDRSNQKENQNENQNEKWLIKWRLDKHEDGSNELVRQSNDSPFAYHLYLLALLQGAINKGQLEKYHFNLLRNLLEKTATFLGYEKWDHLLPKDNAELPFSVTKRLVNIGSHSKHSGDEVGALGPGEKKILTHLVKHLIDKHSFHSPDFPAETGHQS